MISEKTYALLALHVYEADPDEINKPTHFAADLNKLGTNIAGLNKAAQEALIAQGIEWYYWQGNDYAGQEFFTQTGSLLQYTTAQGASLPDAQDRASSYVRPWLDQLYTANTGTPRFAPMGTGFGQWNVATSATTGAVVTASNLDQTQSFIGQGGNDTFNGGNRADVMFAGVGNDRLSGGNGYYFFCASAQPCNDTAWRLAA
jgi:Ca2+-binding RTX toxin-like protein